MIIRGVINIFFRSPKHEWASLTHMIKFAQEYETHALHGTWSTTCGIGICYEPSNITWIRGTTCIRKCSALTLYVIYMCVCASARVYVQRDKSIPSQITLNQIYVGWNHTCKAITHDTLHCLMWFTNIANDNRPVITNKTRALVTLVIGKPTIRGFMWPWCLQGFITVTT